jgi:hypothetical protein
MIDYDYEQAQMRIERKEYKMTKAEKRAELNRKLDHCTDVREYMKLLARLA